MKPPGDTSRRILIVLAYAQREHLPNLTWTQISRAIGNPPRWKLHRAMTGLRKRGYVWFASTTRSTTITPAGARAAVARTDNNHAKMGRR